MNKIVVAGVLVSLAGLSLLGVAAFGRRPASKAALVDAPKDVDVDVVAASAPAPRRGDWDRGAPRLTDARRAAPPSAASAQPAEPEPQTPEQVSASLNAAFEADRPADATSSNTRVAIASAFRDPKAHGAELRAIDCRATRCRLSVAFTDRGADKRVLSDFFKLLASAGVDTKDLGFTVPEREVGPDGAIVATIHLYRDDAAL